MDYLIPISFLLLGFAAAFVAGRSLHLRVERDALKKVPLKAGAVRLDLLAGKGVRAGDEGQNQG